MNLKKHFYWAVLPFVFVVCASMNLPEMSTSTPFVIGQKIDSLHGVYVFYNGKVSNVLARNLAPDGYNLGLKYQCVEFVKRYYYLHLNHKMPDSYGNAKDFFDLNLKDAAQNKARDLTQYTNYSSVKPKVSDLLVFSGNKDNKYGHVAIVSAVSDREIEIIQQNPVYSSQSRAVFLLHRKGGRWHIDHTDVLGWLRKKDLE